MYRNRFWIMPGTSNTYHPFFSIIIPCFNQAHFLSDAVNSVIQQDFQKWELIIVDDGSTDDTLLLAKTFAAEDERIQVFHKTNGGLSSARNAGIDLAKGTYLHFLDSDDKVLPGIYANVFSRLSDTIDIHVCGYHYFQDAIPFHQVSYGNHEFGVPDLLQRNIAPPSAFVLRSSLLKTIGGFDESLKSVEDWDLWIRAAKAGARIVSIPEVLVGYRYVPGSMSRDAFRMYNALKIVSLRAPEKDHRILSESGSNRDYEIDTAQVIKGQLMRCLGVSLMQGKIEESVALFLKEKEQYGWNFAPHDFAAMSSYLSFRYFRKPAEVDHLFGVVLPYFQMFFRQTGLSENAARQAIKFVFDAQLKIRNHQRYGRFLGALVNRLL